MLALVSHIYLAGMDDSTPALWHTLTFSVVYCYVLASGVCLCLCMCSPACVHYDSSLPLEGQQASALANIILHLTDTLGTRQTRA